MNRRRDVVAATLGLLMMGCAGEGPPAGESAVPGERRSAAAETPSTPPPMPAEFEETGDSPDEGRTVALSPENSRIQFIGTHAGDDPNPRTGEFTEFRGTARVDAASDALRSVSMEIQAASLTTPIENLTNHLQSQDFLDVREYPTITFESTRIENDDAGATITGDLTLMDVTKEVSFPAEVTVADGRLSLSASFTINRSEFGMDGSLDRVEDEVEIKVTVGD